MKKFTVSFLTAFLIVLISVLSCFSVYAEEIVIDGEQTASIPADEFWDWSNDGSLSTGYSLQSNENSFLFYDQLDANNKAAYNVMKAWLNPRTDTLTITLPEPVSHETDSLDMSSWSDEQSTEFWDIVLSCIKDGKNALTLDYPELFWFDENTVAVSISYSTSYNFRKKIYTIKVNKVYVTASVCDIYEDTQKAMENIELLKSSIENLEVEGDDYYTKVKFIHDYVAKKVKYNLQAPYKDTALGVFIEPFEVVCEGYSESVKLLCDKENIPCISVIGNVNMSKKTAHMWNYIQMEDGKWYGLDCTWDDLDNETNPVKYQYFLTGSASFLTGHTPDNEYITPNFIYPELSETDYVYNSGSPVVTTTTSVTTVQITTTTTTAATSAATTDSHTSSNTTADTAAVTTTSSSTSATEPPVIVTVIKGDFNENGKLDIGDAVLLQKKLIRLEEIKKSDFKYELNGDNVINVWDFIIIRRLLINQQ